jgi:hypothetical protein
MCNVIYPYYDFILVFTPEANIQIFIIWFSLLEHPGGSYVDSGWLSVSGMYLTGPRFVIG